MLTRKKVSQQYKLLEVIGKGKFGTVHKGINVDTNQVVAIKILNLDTDYEEVKDIQQEVRFLCELKTVPNITHYFGSYLNGHKLWILMDYCAGGSVRTLLKPGPLSEQYIAVITRELLIALQFIHENGVIHRDIKAANILISKEGKVKLCDFGVAAQLTSTAVKRTTMAGTPYWMAPEVITEGATYNAKADIWSTGVTVYEMATGNPPYSDKDALRAMQFITQHEPPRLEGRQYGPLLKEMVAISLEEKPDLRPSAEDLLKSKFIKNSKTLSTTILKEVIGKYLVWRDNRNSSSSSSLNGENPDNVNDENNDTHKNNNYDNNNNRGLTNHAISSAVSIAETTTSSESGEVIKWDFDSLKSAEYLVENDIDLNQHEKHDKFDEFYFETNNVNSNRDFTTSPYNRTFTIGNTMINNAAAENRGLTATATQIDSIVNSSNEFPRIRQPPKSLLQLFQTDDEIAEEESNSNNIANVLNQSNSGMNISNNDSNIIENPLSISIPSQTQQSIEILPTPTTMRQQITSPLVPIEIPNMDAIENEIQEREKQRSRAATLNASALNSNNTTKVESLINDQPLPMRKPTLTIASNRTPSPAKALEQINTNLHPSPSKQTSPLHMKPLPVNLSQPLLQPINNTNKVKNTLNNLSNITTHKNLMGNNILNNNGPQTAPITSTSNSEMLDSSIRARSQMRIQMPIPVSATASTFTNVLMKEAGPNANNNIEMNQFGFDVNAAATLPMAMTPVTEKPATSIVTPEREISRSEVSYTNNSNHTIHSSTKLSQYATLSKNNSNSNSTNNISSNGNINNQIERKMSSESNLKMLHSNAQSYLNFNAQETRVHKNSINSNHDENERVGGAADVTLTNENTSVLTSVENDNVVTGLGMMTVDNGKISPARVNSNNESLLKSSNLPSDQLFNILNSSQISMNRITNVGLGLADNNNDFNGIESQGFYINEMDNLLGNMSDILELMVSGLK